VRGTKGLDTYYVTNIVIIYIIYIMAKIFCKICPTRTRVRAHAHV